MAPFVLLGLNSPNCYALFIFPSKDDESQEEDTLMILMMMMMAVTVMTAMISMSEGCSRLYSCCKT